MIEPIEIIDTAVKVGLGALITAISGFCLENFRKKTERIREQEQRHLEDILKPVVAFIDEMLILMSKAYWETAEGNNSAIDERLEALRQQEAMIEARVNAIDNQQLTEHYRKLDKVYCSFMYELQQVKDEGTGQIRKELAEASEITGKLLKVIYPLQ